jgi:hypothetical protein
MLSEDSKNTIQFIRQIRSLKPILTEYPVDETAKALRALFGALFCRGVHSDNYRGYIDILDSLLKGIATIYIPNFSHEHWPIVQTRLDDLKLVVEEVRKAIQPPVKNLPPGWEAKYTPTGRVYYIEASTKTVTWVKPRENQLKVQPVENQPEVEPTENQP